MKAWLINHIDSYDRQVFKCFREKDDAYKYIFNVYYKYFIFRIEEEIKWELNQNSNDVDTYKKGLENLKDIYNSAEPWQDKYNRLGTPEGTELEKGYFNFIAYNSPSAKIEALMVE